MSNDLISRSELMQSLRGNVLVDVTPNLEQAIAEQPTAYDVEKIVERLEELREMVPVNRLLDDIIKDKPKELGQLIAYRKAIEIVKSGGIE